MKKFLFLIIICIAQNTLSQSKSTGTVSDKENQIYNTAGLQTQPAFPGGLEEFQKFLNTNFIPPQEKPQLKGKVYATFIIEKDGSLSDIKIIRDLGFGTGDEAVRVLKSAPKWIAGKQDNKEVRTLFATSINVR